MEAFDSLSAVDRQRVVIESNKLIEDFADSDFGKSINSGTVFVLIPSDNPILAEVNLARAKKEEQRGNKVLRISASRLDQKKPYTIFSTYVEQPQGKPA